MNNSHTFNDEPVSVKYLSSSVFVSYIVFLLFPSRYVRMTVWYHDIRNIKWYLKTLFVSWSSICTFSIQVKLISTNLFFITCQTERNLQNMSRERESKNIGKKTAKCRLCHVIRAVLIPLFVTLNKYDVWQMSHRY